MARFDRPRRELLAMAHGAGLRERLDKATLQKLYLEHELSTVQIATRYGTQPSRVLRLMEEYAIPRRARGARRT